MRQQSNNASVGLVTIANRPPPPFMMNSKTHWMSHLNITRPDLGPFESATKRYEIGNSSFRIYHSHTHTQAALHKIDVKTEQISVGTYSAITITKVYGGAESASLAKCSKRS